MITLSKQVTLACILLLAAFSNAAAQDNSAGAAGPPAYKIGQVWTNRQALTVTILAIEDVRKVGRIVHVRIDRIPVQTCGNLQLTRSIEYLAVTEKMMRASGLDLLKDNVDLPESSIEAFRTWQLNKKHEIAKVPIQKAILPSGPQIGPMICNFIPGQT